MYYFLWFCLGVALAVPLMLLAEKVKPTLFTHLMGSSLIIAAMIYIGFAIVWGDSYWLKVELAGVLLYGSFYLLALRYTPIWLAIGWLLHPIWDIVLHLKGPGSHVAPEWYAVVCLAFDVAIATYIFLKVVGRFSEKSA